MESPAKDHRLPPVEAISLRLESFLPSNRISTARAVQHASDQDNDGLVQ